MALLRTRNGERMHKGGIGEGEGFCEFLKCDSPYVVVVVFKKFTQNNYPPVSANFLLDSNCSFVPHPLSS